MFENEDTSINLKPNYLQEIKELREKSIDPNNRDALIIKQTCNEILEAVEAKELSPNTRYKYSQEIKKLKEKSIDPNNRDALNKYIQQLNISSRKFLEAAINAWKNMPTSMEEKKTSGSSNDQKTTEDNRYLWLTLDNIRRLSKQLDILLGNKDSGDLKDYLLAFQKKIVFFLIVGAGLRRKEAQEITWNSIDKTTQSILIYRNGALHRSVPIDNKFIETLEEWEKIVGKQGRILRKINDDGSFETSLNTNEITEIVKDVGNLIEIRLTPESLRRGYVQIGLQLGYSLKEISKHLGHRNVGETIRYLESGKVLAQPVCSVLSSK